MIWSLCSRTLRALLLPAAFLLPFANAAHAQVFNPTTFELDNGMQVVVIENHRAPVVTHMVWYRVGAADEPAGKSGIAHYLEHLMFKGTETRASGEFSQIIADLGGRENAFTSQDYTGYFQTISPRHLGLMMELEADRMTGLILTDEIIEPERRVILEERRSRTGNNPRSLLSEQVAAATYLNHPYRLPVIGWAHEIEGLSRADLESFYETWYAPNNAVLVVSGDVDPAEVFRLARETYGKIEAKVLPPRFRPVEPPQLAPREVVMRDARVDQPAWSRRYLAPSYVAGDNEHAYALELLAEIIGGGATGRIYRSIVVDQSLAASAGAWYSPGDLDLTTFGVWFSPRPGVPVDTVRDAMDDQIADLLKDGITADELERAKQRLIDSAIFARDSVAGPARVLGAALASGQTVADVEAWPDRIRAVTVEQVDAAAREVFNVNRSTTGVLLPVEGDSRT
ncbi:MAG: insulinase family protein [Rhodospirillaceae bacterium]|jgi:zinc protease|nr:insulinase family protein [Rhodospirillaceae bacterium]MBT6534994.1 insulinase family protein [Rhodospirillaceae bacterium]MBT7361503.1 insulinase family protein [Rhodospirillaceae bacterium]